MSPLYTILTFLVVMGVISIPLAAVITRKNSAIGQALGDRIRRRTETRETRRTLASGPALPGATPSRPAVDPAAQAAQQQILEAQQEEIRELSGKLDFIQRLLEKQDGGESR